VVVITLLQLTIETKSIVKVKTEKFFFIDLYFDGKGFEKSFCQNIKQNQKLT